MLQDTAAKQSRSAGGPAFAGYLRADSGNALVCVLDAGFGVYCDGPDGHNI